MHRCLSSLPHDLPADDDDSAAARHNQSSSPSHPPRPCSHDRTQSNQHIIQTHRIPSPGATIQPQDSTSSSAKALYAVSHKASYLPFGLWEGKVNFTCEFEDTEDGVKTVVNAGLGFVSKARWVVEERERLRKDADESRAEREGELVLLEMAEITCPRLMRMFVEGTMKTSHEEICARFVEKLSSEDGE